MLSATVSQLFPHRDRPSDYSFKILLQRWKQVAMQPAEEMEKPHTAEGRKVQ